MAPRNTNPWNKQGPTKQQKKKAKKNEAPSGSGGGGGKQQPSATKATNPGAGFGGGIIGSGGPGGVVTAPPPPGQQLTPPPYTPPPGYEWVYADGQWSMAAIGEAEEPEEETPFNNSAMAYLQGILEQFGLATPGLLEFARSSIAQGKDATQILQELRQQPDYLANPLFAANVQRAADGGGWMAEGQVIAYANEAKRLAKQFGFQEPSDNYIAMGLGAGKSLAEYEHALTVQRRVYDYGAGVAMAWKEIYGDDPSDEDLFDVFDPERNTADRDRALRQAELRGRPFTLGLGIRSEAEARALEMLGVSPDEAFSRYQGVAQNAPRFERLRAIEDLVSQGLPDTFGAHLTATDNGLLIRALVFQQPDALAELQSMTSREIARFKQSGGVVSTQNGQAVGLLDQAERASFG